jgi:RHS repeat-associated protein
MYSNFSSSFFLLDYLPFGQVMPNRHGNDETYKYGFNDMLKDDELKGNSNSYDFGARIYDPRLGRWLSRDPHESKYPAVSGYNFSLNSPLLFKDPDGKDAIITVTTVGNITTVTFSSTVYLTGKGVDQKFIDECQEMINSINNKGLGYQKDGKTLLLKLDVKYVLASQAKDRDVIQYDNARKSGAIPLDAQVPNKNQSTAETEEKKSGLDYGDNLIIVGYSANTTAGPVESQAWLEDYKFDPKEVTTTLQKQYAVVHETLHLLGLSDRYNKELNKKPESHKGYENDWMGAATKDKILNFTQNTFSNSNIQSMVEAGLQVWNSDQKVKNIYSLLLSGQLDKNAPGREPAKIDGKIDGK